MERVVYLVSDSRDILLELESIEDNSTLLPEYENKELIDEILGELLHQRSIPKMLKNVTLYGSGTGFTLLCRERPYGATVADYQTLEDETTIHHQLTFCLSCDGFRYPRVDPKDYVETVHYHGRSK